MAESKHVLARQYSILLAWWVGMGSLLANPADALRLLKAECFGCHNSEKHKGDLDLTVRQGVRNVIALGKFRLVEVLAADADPHMPPKKQLSEKQITLLRSWLEAGAPWDDAALAEPVVTLRELPLAYRPSFAVATSGPRLAVARGGAIAVYEIGATNTALLTEAQAHTDAVQALAFSADGKLLASGAHGRVILWETDALKPKLQVTNNLPALVSALHFHSNFLVVAVGGEVQLRNVTDGQVVASWKGHTDTVYDLDVSPDGQRLVTAGGDRMVKVWEVASRKEIATLEGHAAQVLAAAFNSNATQVVSGGADHELTVWDIATREKISALGRHKDAITAVSWPGDAGVIFATREDGTLLSYRNLKRHSGEQSSASGDERRLAQGTNALSALAVSADGKDLFTGAQDGVVVRWSGEGKRVWEAQETRSGGRGATHAEVRQPQELATFDGGAGGNATSRVDPVLSMKRPVIVGLLADPPEVRLSGDATTGRVLIGAQLTDGRVIDVTMQARYSDNFSRNFKITSQMQIAARGVGKGVLSAHYRGFHVDVPVHVNAIRNDHAPTFIRDVLPVLSKAGCNAGACHAKPEGQNGFKLSVFSYDPLSDYYEIVREARGRRVFPAAPEESLVLKKPTAAVPHEGGQRFEPGSEPHQLLVRWISSGMPFAATNEPTLTHVAVFPKRRNYVKGASQPLLLLAHYSDGSVRDVTRLAVFESNDKEIAKVSDQGLITIGHVSGQSVVVARYMGRVADAHVLVPSDRVLPAGQFAKLPRNNFIDDLAYAQFQKAGVLPSDLCTDAEFLRRAKLDAIGLLPTPDEVRAFLADTSPDKRGRAIAEILNDPAYADYWANKWADLVRPNPDRVGVKSVFTLDQWLRASFRANKPYDEFVREILLAEGSNHRDGPAVIYRDRRDPPELTTMFSQLFLGTRMECARCHHHPNEKWSQDDFYHFAAFFGSVKRKGAGLSPPISAGRETFYFTAGGTVKHPVSGEAMSPKPLDGPVPQLAAETDPRRALVDWLMAPDNPYFAKAAVNRVWANFFGRGLVEPVDDFRVSNPCVNPELLDALARDFAQNGYDLKHLMRTIMGSRLYQLSSTPNRSNLADTKNFSRAYRRRLPAEVLLDAVNDATAVPSSFEAMPPASRALQTWSYKIDSHFMDAFGRPNPSSDCPCERDTHLSVVQSLHLMNAKDVQSKLVNANGRARQLADSGRTPEEIVSELYLAALSRFPTPDETRAAVAAFSVEGATRRGATEDVFWALLNSAEFVLNH